MGHSYSLVFPRNTNLQDIDFASMWEHLNAQTLDGECWKDIPEYKGVYQASTLGRIRSIPRYTYDRMGRIQVQKGCILRQYPTGKYRNYRKVMLWKDNKYKNVPVHRLVAAAFVPNPENKPSVDHIDRNPSNNEASNLRWATYEEQSRNSSVPVHIRCIEDNLEFSSCDEAARHYNVYSTYIGKSIKSGKVAYGTDKHFEKM